MDVNDTRHAVRLAISTFQISEENYWLPISITSPKQQQQLLDLVDRNFWKFTELTETNLYFLIFF